MTSNGNALLINLPPDQTGRLRENEVKTVLALADRLGIRGGNKPLPKRGPNLLEGARTNGGYGAGAETDTSLETAGGLSENTGTLEIDPGKPVTFDRIVLVEHADMKGLGDGFSSVRNFRVKKFDVEALVDGAWKKLYDGTTIGATLAIRTPRTTATKLRINFREATGHPALLNIGAFDSAQYGTR